MESAATLSTAMAADDTGVEMPAKEDADQSRDCPAPPAIEGDRHKKSARLVGAGAPLLVPVSTPGHRFCCDGEIIVQLMEKCKISHWRV